MKKAIRPEEQSRLLQGQSKDPTFPKPIKFSDTLQAAAYYVIAEVDAWLRSKIEARDAA